MAFRPSATNHEQIPSSTQHTQRSRLSFGAHFPPPSSLTTSHHLPSPYTDYYPSGMMNPSFRPILSEHMPYSSPSTPLHNTTIRRVLTPSTYGSVPSIRRRPATQNNHHRPDPTRNHMTQSYGLAGNTTNDQPRASTSFISTEPVSLFAVPPTSQHASELRQGPPSLNSDTPSHKANAGTAKAAGPIRKRRRTEEYDDVDEESGSNGANDDEEGLVANKACIRCNRDKVKCRYRSGSTTCVRCRQKGHQCQAREVKLSPSASRKKYVEAQLREKDAIIESLLKELYNPYRAHPLSVRTMEETSPRTTDDHPETQEWRERLTKGVDKTDVGIFSFCSPADETGQSASPAHSPANHSPISESSRDGGPLDDAAPIEMLTKMSLEDRADAEAEERSDSSASSTAADDQAGPANAAYFKPGAGMDLRLRSKMELEYRTSPLISHKLMTEEDVLELFKIYHSKLNAFVPLLDPIIHTPQNAYARCPALFSVVCAVASRYYKKKSHMYPIVMHIARNEASTAVMNGWKSIELAQAFLLLALWAPPAKKWEDERGYLYTGIATRIAIDLNAHLCPSDLPKNEEEDRERLNKRRLWMICFETDWAMAAHYGKPASVKENQIIRTSDGFYHCSSFNNNLVGDIGLSAYNKLLRLVAKFHTDVYSNPDSRTGLRRDIDFPRLVEEYSAQLDDLQHEWAEKFAAHSKFQDDPVFELRCNLFPYVVEYKRLLMQSFEFQQALERGMQPQDRDIITRCINSATQVLRTFIWKLVPGGYLLYAPNGWINYGAFAAAFLCKLLRPQFSDLITLEERHMIIELITNLLDTLHSSQVAMDERHTPKLWAYFFEQLLAKLDRTLPVQASPTELVGSSSPEEWSGSVQPYPNAATSYYGQDPGLYQTYEVWSQMPDVNYWLHSQQSLQQYQSAGGFGQSMMGNEGLEYSYAMPDPNSLGSDNVMMPGYQWNLSSYEDPYATNYGYRVSPH